MTLAWTEADLAARGFAPDGRRLVQPIPASPAAPFAGRDGATGGLTPVVGENARAAAQAVNAGPGSIGDRAGNEREAPSRLSTAALRRLTPEQRLQLAVVQIYRPQLVPGARLLGVNGELPGGGRLQAMRAAIRRELGYQRGQADMLTVRPGHVLWLELKAGSDQSEEQALFAEWAHGIGHGYAVATGVEDAGVVLKIHGMVR